MRALRRAAWAAAALVWAAAVSAADDTAADAVRGRRLYDERCSACHSVQSDRVGPRHQGVFGRRVGSVSGYAYSPALQRSSLMWTAANLDAWLRDPEAFIPGQKMGYSVADVRDRADLIAYLRSLSTQ